MRLESEPWLRMLYLWIFWIHQHQPLNLFQSWNAFFKGTSLLMPWTSKDPEQLTSGNVSPGLLPGVDENASGSMYQVASCLSSMTWRNWRFFIQCELETPCILRCFAKLQSRDTGKRFCHSLPTRDLLPVASPANVPRMRTSISSLIWNAPIKHIKNFGTIKLADLSMFPMEIEKRNGSKRSLHSTSSHWTNPVAGQLLQLSRPGSLASLEHPHGLHQRGHWRPLVPNPQVDHHLHPRIDWLTPRPEIEKAARRKQDRIFHFCQASWDQSHAVQIVLPISPPITGKG